MQCTGIAFFQILDLCMSQREAMQWKKTTNLLLSRFLFQCMISNLPEYSGLLKEFTISTCFLLLLRASASMNTSISIPSTITIGTTMTIAAITPTGSSESTGGIVVTGEGRNELVWGVEAAENCTGACVCRVWIICEVPVRVIMRGGGCTVEVVARTLLVGRPEDEENGVGEGVCEGDDVCEGDGVDGKTTAVMTGTAAVVEVSS